MRRAAVLAVTVLLLFMLAVTPVSAATCSADAETVVVVLAPYLTWEDITSGATPVIALLAEKGATGSVSVRAGLVEDSPPSTRGAAILSAGEPVETPDPESVTPVAPCGSLGQLVRASDGFTAAISASAEDVMMDGCYGASPAFLVAGDMSGDVSYSIGPDELVTPDPDAACGVTADVEAIATAYSDVLSMSTDPCLVIVDAGELDRARLFTETAAEWEVLRRAAAGVTDEVVTAVYESLPNDAVLVIVSTAQYEGDGPSGLAPVIVCGVGSGMLYSPGTRTEGLVTLPDLTVTIMDLLDIDAPEGTTGQVISVGGEDITTADRVAQLLTADSIARSLEALRMPVWMMLGGSVLVMLCAGVGVVLLMVNRGDQRIQKRFLVSLSHIVAYLLLAIMVFPLGTLLVRVFSAPETVQSAWLHLAGWCCCLMVAAMSLALRRGLADAVGSIACANAIFIVADQFVGAPLATGAPLSYSVIFGTRFYGLGNEGAALLVGAVFVAVAWLVNRGVCAPGTFLVFGVLAVVVAVVPSLGANVGVAAWGTAACAGAYLYAARRRVTWRVVIMVMVGVGVILGIAALLDLTSSNASHFGQMLESLTSGGEGIAGIIGRKITLGLETLLATPVMLALPVGIFLVICLLMFPRGPFGEFIQVNRGSAAALTGAVTAALAALITEDSGAAVAALVLLLPVVSLVVLTLDRVGDSMSYKTSCKMVGCVAEQGSECITDDHVEGV